MFAKINHMAIVSSNHLGVGKFYEAIFGMKFQGDRRGGLGAVTVRDGYVGLTSIRASLAGPAASIISASRCRTSRRSMPRCARNIRW